MVIIAIWRQTAAGRMKKLEQVVSAAQRALEDPEDFLELVEKHVGVVQQSLRLSTSAAYVLRELPLFLSLLRACVLSIAAVIPSTCPSFCKSFPKSSTACCGNRCFESRSSAQRT